MNHEDAAFVFLVEMKRALARTTFMANTVQGEINMTS